MFTTIFSTRRCSTVLASTSAQIHLHSSGNALIVLRAVFPSLCITIHIPKLQCIQFSFSLLLLAVLIGSPFLLQYSFGFLHNLRVLQRHFRARMVSLKYPKLLYCTSAIRPKYCISKLWAGLGWSQIPILHQQSYRLMLHSLKFLPENTEKLDLFTPPYILLLGTTMKENLQGHITWLLPTSILWGYSTVYSQLSGRTLNLCLLTKIFHELH